MCHGEYDRNEKNYCKINEKKGGKLSEKKNVFLIFHNSKDFHEFKQINNIFILKFIVIRVEYYLEYRNALICIPWYITGIEIYPMGLWHLSGILDTGINKFLYRVW